MPYPVNEDLWRAASSFNSTVEKAKNDAKLKKLAEDGEPPANPLEAAKKLNEMDKPEITPEDMREAARTKNPNAPGR